MNFNFLVEELQIGSQRVKITFQNDLSLAADFFSWRRKKRGVKRKNKSTFYP